MGGDRSGVCPRAAGEVVTPHGAATAGRCGGELPAVGGRDTDGVIRPTVGDLELTIGRAT